MKQNHPEYWLRGPVEGVPPLLQPIAHALLQALSEVESAIAGFPPELLWERPGGVASVGFHLRHLTGVQERLLTYARGGSLSSGQLALLASEGTPAPNETPDDLVLAFREQVFASIEQLRRTDDASLTSAREVGRGRLPSTVIGLLFHAAEHSQRHVGQLLVTVRIQTPDNAPE